MADLTLRFTRIAPDRHRFEYVRPDGSGEVVEMETHSMLTHDLVHFAVESEAGLQGSFYGLLAKFGDYQALAANVGGLGGEAMMTEMIVGPLQGALKGDLDADSFVEQVNEYREDMGVDRIPWLSADFVRAAEKRFRALEGQWKATAFGQTMELKFPLRG